MKLRLGRNRPHEFFRAGDALNNVFTCAHARAKDERKNTVEIKLYFPSTTLSVFHPSADHSHDRTWLILLPRVVPARAFWYSVQDSRGSIKCEVINLNPNVPDQIQWRTPESLRPLIIYTYVNKSMFHFENENSYFYLIQFNKKL